MKWCSRFRHVSQLTPAFANAEVGLARRGDEFRGGANIVRKANSSGGGPEPCQQAVVFHHGIGPTGGFRCAPSLPPVEPAADVANAAPATERTSWVSPRYVCLNGGRSVQDRSAGKSCRRALEDNAPELGEWLILPPNHTPARPPCALDKDNFPFGDIPPEGPDRSTVTAIPPAKLRGAGLITVAALLSISITAKPRSLVPSERNRNTPSAPLKPETEVSAAGP